MLKHFLVWLWLCPVCVLAEVLIVADEFPAMEVVAAKLAKEENLKSKLISQKELPAGLTEYETVVVYIHGALAPAAEHAFIQYATNGGKLVVIHHSISSGKRKNQSWFGFLGVALPEGDVSKGGYKWIEEIAWDLVNLNPNHFIMTNRVKYPARVPYSSTNAASADGKLPGFRLQHSEVYLNHVHTAGRTLLMGFRYEDEKSGITYTQDRAGWLQPAGKGTIIYLMPGHTVDDFKDPTYGQIVANAISFKPK